jgi:hypothetical protein
MLRLPAFLTRVASEYEALSHRPHDTDVQAAYHSLCECLDAQFHTLCGLVDIRFTSVDPYPTSAAMFADVAENRRLKVYTVADLPSFHPMGQLHPSGQTFNAIFRAVHDGLAHYPGRNSFGYCGEFAAFKAHCRMMPGNVKAMHALATETLGQNAVYNFGDIRGTFAPQYAALLPWSTIRQALTEVSI